MRLRSVSSQLGGLQHLLCLFPLTFSHVVAAISSSHWSPYPKPPFCPFSFHSSTPLQPRLFQPFSYLLHPLLPRSSGYVLSTSQNKESTILTVRVCAHVRVGVCKWSERSHAGRWYWISFHHLHPISLSYFILLHSTNHPLTVCHLFMGSVSISPLKYKQHAVRTPFTATTLVPRVVPGMQ